MKKRKKIQRLALFLMLTLALSTLSAFPGLTKAQESVDSGNAEWTPSTDCATVNNSEGDLSLDELAVKVLSKADIPEVIDTGLIAEKQHVNRLRAQETDMNTIIFQNTDGTKSMYYYGVPVKYMDPDGVIRDKSNKVIENQDKAAFPEYAYQNKANDIGTLFPQILSQEDGIVLENAGTKIELIPYNYENSDADETSVAESSARREEYVHTDGESADAVIYDNVFGGGTKLRYTPTFMGFKEDLILEQNTGINRFQFILKSGELQAVPENGGIYLIDPLTGETEATVSPIYVYDSYKGIKSYENTHDTWNNEMTLKELDSDGNYLVAITVDEKFLNDPDTVYPVYVDPTLTFAENTDINDAIIYSGSPSVAHGSNYYNYIGYYNTMYGVGRLLVKFPGMTGNGTYASLWDSQLLSVYYNAYTDGTNQSTTIRPYIYTGSAWTESTVTCNMVSWNGTVTLTDMPAVTVPNSAGNIAFDITAAAKAWKNETYSASSGLMLKNSNEYSSSYYKIFTSTEYGSYYGTHMPYTVVNYSVVTLPTYETQGIASGDIFKITNTYSGKSIDIEGGGTTDNTNAIQYSFSTSGFTRSSSNQWFEITYIGTGEYEIRPMHTTGKILSINSTSKNVIIETDCNYTRQRWYIVKSGDDYYIINKAYKTEFITVEGSYTSGDPVKSSTNSSGSKWKFVDLNIFHLNSRYDDSYFSAYPNAADNISRIDTYHDFAALAYDDFGITIKSDAYAQHISSLADECSRGLTTACNNDCGTNCFTDHHKNTLALSDEIFNGSRDENHIYVQWMEYNTNVLCSSNNATHTSTGALASVWNKRPVIGMYGRQNNNRDRIGKAVLIHEMAHSFGHRDVYDDDGHDQIFITGCAMEKYKVELWPYEPVKDFIEDVENGDVAFCEDCIDEMEPLIENRYFAGN